jgi:hypothetical protein
MFLVSWPFHGRRSDFSVLSLTSEVLSSSFDFPVAFKPPSIDEEGEITLCVDSLAPPALDDGDCSPCSLAAFSDTVASFFGLSCSLSGFHLFGEGASA